MDWSVGDRVSHQDRQFTGACGEAAVACFLDLDPLVEIERKIALDRADGGITYELAGIGSFEVRTTRAESPEGLMRSQRAKRTADWWINCRHGYSTKPGWALVFMRGYIRREDWPKLQKVRVFGEGDRRQEVPTVAISDLRHFGLLLAGLSRARASL